MFNPKLSRTAAVHATKKDVSRNQLLSKRPPENQNITNLTPLSRLARFKKLQEKYRGKEKTKPINKHSKKIVTFASMETETTVVNGSHEPEVEAEEKVLKLRKSVLSNEISNNMQNGNNENGTESEENGHEIEIENTEDDDKKNLHQHDEDTKKESTQKRQSNKRTIKEASPPKRELRPRESTPKHEVKRRGTPVKVTEEVKRQGTPVKVIEEVKRRGTPVKVTEEVKRQGTPVKVIEEVKRRGTPVKVTEEVKRQGTPVKVIETTSNKIFEEKKLNDGQQNVEPVLNGEELISKETVIDPAKQDSVITIEETDNEESIISINESVKSIPTEEPKGIFSAFRKSFKSNSFLSGKDKCEASLSQSIICLDSPSMVDDKYSPLPNNDIKGRKPIHSFSRFPGRNVSYESTDSRKRSANDSFGENVKRMRFAGETESGSEKSPGWNFFSPGIGRVWSPAQRDKSFLPSSTPLHKKMDQDSMAVNYNEDTALSLSDTEGAQPSQHVGDTPAKSHKWCNVM